MTTKFIAVLSLLGLISLNCANAADISFHEHKATLVKMPEFNWQGFYIGGEAAYRRQNMHNNVYNSLDVHNYSNSYNSSNSFLGGFVGYSQPLRNKFILGVETDMLWNNVPNTEHYRFKGSQADVNLGLKEQWNGSSMVNIGYRTRNWEPYLSFGIAYMRVDSSYTKRNLLPYPHIDPKAAKKTFAGWALGGGINYALTHNLLLRLAYRYSDYGKKEFNQFVNNNWSPEIKSAEVKYHSNDVRLGLAYKF